MKTLYMLRGIPASGKTTVARSMLASAQHNTLKRVNKDNLRDMLDNGYHSKGNEKFMRQVQEAIVEDALYEGYDVVVDDTNLLQADELRWSTVAKKYGATFVVIDLMDVVSVEDCIERDLDRSARVGPTVIRWFYQRWLEERGKYEC